MKAFDEELEGNLERIHESLQSGTSKACPVRRGSIPKPNGEMRPLGIPSLRDRVVQEAVRMVLEPIFEADFSQYSFGFRPNRRTMDAIRCITFSSTESKKAFWVVEGDISSYFDTIHHRKLVKLLRRRVKDGKLLDLLWQFLRAGVMERGLFKDTKLGTPQGGIASPLLANVYLHELDKYMEHNYTVCLSNTDKRKRRAGGMANHTYVRYADDFVILCNGTRGDAEAIRREVHDFLRDELRLTLSMEKTKVTHLNDGFDFLGFTLRRSMGSRGVGVKTLISAKAVRRHLDFLKAALNPTTQEGSFAAKVMALNRAIAGWCRYYQYTSKASTQFGRLDYETFWMAVHWLCRKHGLSIPECLKRYNRPGSGLGVGEIRLISHRSYPSQTYRELFLKPNPYTTMTALEREDLPESESWTGIEERPGWLDIRLTVLERDGYRCQQCGDPVTSDTAQVDHIRGVRHFKRPVNANYPENLWTLCVPCHKEKTERDRQRESRVR